MEPKMTRPHTLDLPFNVMEKGIVGIAVLQIDVRKYGFLDTDEFRRDPDAWRYIANEVQTFLVGREPRAQFDG